MKIKVIISGMKEVQTALRFAANSTPGKVFATVKKIMYMMDREVQRNLRGGNPLHKRSNRLSSGIFVDVAYSGKDKVEGIIGTDVFYGMIHEYGGTFAVPQHQMKLDHFWSTKVIDIFGIPYITVTRGPYLMKVPERPWMRPAIERVLPKAQDILLAEGIVLKL